MSKCHIVGNHISGLNFDYTTNRHEITVYSFPTGYANAIYGGPSTKLELADISGDATATIHVTDQQVLKAAVVDGVISIFETNIHIIVGPEGTLLVPYTVKIVTVTLDLHGTATFKELVVENKGTFKTHSTTFTSILGKNGIEPNSEPGSLILSSIKLKSGSNYQPEGSLKLQCWTIDMQRLVVMETDFVDIVAGTVNLQRGATLNVRGRASPSDPIVPENSHGIDKNGGAHAAQGGVGSGSSIDIAAQPYGILYRKEDMEQTAMRSGSSGGGGGMGGGYIKITADDFILDGILQASGADSTAGGGGGGGSIYVQVKQLKGLGSMVSDGGSVTCHDCGAGSGGYIGVNMVTDSFEGKYAAAGGTSPAPNGNGGPGSIYTVSGTNGEKLIVDNSKSKQKIFSMTLEERDPNIEFDFVVLYDYARLQIKEDGRETSIKINKVDGDSTATLIIRTNQTGYVERVPSTTGAKMDSKLKINLELHHGGAFILSERTSILGLADIALDLDGTVKGVKDMILGTQRNARIGPNARILPSEYAVVDETAPKVSFGILQLEPGSVCEYDPNIGAQISTGSLNLKFAAKIKADYFEINSSNIDLELESEMSCSGVDRPDSDTMDITDGSGKVGAVEIGGAGHGGEGGGSKDLSGSPYNSLYFPEKSGSRGTVKDGTKLGGKGGGRIHLRVGSQLINDGKLSADGEPANSEGGGGSGGSILVETYDIEGYGEISSAGGQGSGISSGGSGGLITILSQSKNLFEGDYTVNGGKGGTDTHSAGGGMVYIRDVRYGKEYHTLLLDNQNLPHKNSTIDEKGKPTHYFNEVHITRNAALHMAENNTGQTIIIDKLFGDGSGLVHIHRTQTAFIEYDTTTRKALITGMNYIVDAGAELLVPSIVYIYGHGVYLSGQTERRSKAIFGTLTGVSDLIIGFDGVLYFGNESNTAFKKDDEYLYETGAGEVQFGTMELRARSQFKFAPDTDATVKSAEINVLFEAMVSAEHIVIQAGILNIEAGATLSTSAIERPEDNRDEELGRGNDATQNVSVGTGGGYATFGGGKNEENSLCHWSS